MNNFILYLPPYLRVSRIIQEILKAESKAYDKIDIDIEGLNNQLFVDTATWGLEIYEKELGLKTDINKDIKERRSQIKSKIRGIGNISAELIKTVIDSYVNGNVDIELDVEEGIKVIFNDVRGRPSDMNDVYNAIERIIPAHLAIMYEFLYTVCQELIDWEVTCNELLVMICDDVKVYEKESDAVGQKNKTRLYNTRR